MGRLIDADELLRNEIARCGCQPLVNDNKLLKDVVNEQPTAYDIDEKVKQLEENYSYDVGNLKMISVDKAIEIVKGGGIDG